MNKKQRDRMARKRQLLGCSKASRGPAQEQPRAAITNTVYPVGLPQQYPTDIGEGTPTRRFVMFRLCRCCAKRLLKRGSTRQREEERMRELRLLVEEKNVMELQRRLDQAARKYESRQREELLQEEVQDKCDAQLSWGLTKQGMKKEFKRLQKLEKTLSLQIHRLQQREGMPAPWTINSTDDDNDERAEEELVRLIKEQQQKSNTKTNECTETTAGPHKLCSQTIQREEEQLKDECPDVEQEPQRQPNGESTMKQQLENAVQRAENKHQTESMEDQVQSARRADTHPFSQILSFSAHKDDEQNAMKQGEAREDTTEDQATHNSNSPSVVPICPSLGADADNLWHDTNDQGTLEKSPSLVNLLACCSDASGGEDGDGRSETASLSQHETADVDYENVNDKSVRRRVLKWINKKAKDYLSKKIEKTFKREEEEGDELYAPWYCTNIQWRSEREQEKRKALLRAEDMRQRLESFLLKWEAKRAQKRAQRMEKEESFDRETQDLWFCEDLL
ncbi:myb-like protein X [Engraulis encrasicolus]|uniref:myb-like protein X n=1 Tax=Engraulis encrasicolus TaxID=184585 RepID=UPI002FD4A7EA